MDITTTQIIERLLLPPGGPILLGFLGLILWKLGLGRRLFVLALLLIWLFSLPVTANWLMAGLERYPALNESDIGQADAQAIVVLGGGRYQDTPEYGGDTVSQRGLLRLRYAAKLARETGLPIIPSGGMPDDLGRAEAEISADILRHELGVVVEQIETRSQTTWENARYTSQLLKKLDLDRVILVTEAFHMPRSMYAFERNGVHPLAAPTHFHYLPDVKSSLLDFLPSGRALFVTADALHEYLGLLWYRLM